MLGERGTIVKEYVTLEYKLDRKTEKGRWTTLTRALRRDRIEADRDWWIEKWTKDGDQIPELRVRVRPTYHLVEEWKTL